MSRRAMCSSTFLSLRRETLREHLGYSEDSDSGSLNSVRYARQPLPALIKTNAT